MCSPERQKALGKALAHRVAGTNPAMLFCLVRLSFNVHDGYTVRVETGSYIREALSVTLYMKTYFEQEFNPLETQFQLLY